MTWPTPQDFNEAVQNPSTNFSDEELKKGETDLNALGLPRAITGAFASVYRIHSAERDFAVRCFLHDIKDQDERYFELSNFIRNDELKYAVNFEYITRGINVRGDWYPILKMEWVEGTGLDQYLMQNVHSKNQVQWLTQKFITMTGDLHERGIAHGDLQHGNILLVDDEIKLVDYDGMFVPPLDGLKSNELGHPNYQHPRRTPRHFGAFLDNFSTWVIYVSLSCLARDRELWMRLNGGDECLLFRQTDLSNPSQSYSFAFLDQHRDAEVRQLAQILKTLTTYPLKQVPRLDPSIRSIGELPGFDDSVVDPDDFIPEDDEVESRGKSMRLARLTNLPDWMQPGESAAVECRNVRTFGPWPHERHYRDAVINCAESFQDPELKNAVPVLTEYGKGPNGIVFHMRCLNRRIAVKCFFHHADERKARYEELSRALVGPAQRYFVEFEYQPEGIKVGNYWYPILKMEWQRGFDLYQIAQFYEADRPRLMQFRDAFRMMMRTLKDVGIAHGDLSPTNLCLSNNDFKLFDYDTVYVPAFEGKRALELGQVNFQHPARSLSDFGSYLDNYSAWIIDTLFMLMIVDQSLYHIVMERLKYTGSDASWAFRFLDWHPNPKVRERVKLLNKFVKMPVDQVPSLDSELFTESSPRGLFSRIFSPSPPKSRIEKSAASSLDETYGDEPER